jgi:hypothetical protein
MKIHLKQWFSGGILRLLGLALLFHKRRRILERLSVGLGFEELGSPSECSISGMILLMNSVLEGVCRLPCMSVYFMWRNTLYFSLQIDEKLNTSLT